MLPPMAVLDSASMLLCGQQRLSEAQLAGSAAGQLIVSYTRM
jgi:hypothetical protein